MPKNGVHCFISGHVQGVFYRANTRRKALELGLTGWVRNLGDGRVELQAFGTPDQLEILTEWLWQGPSAAKVDDVTSQDIPWQDFKDFMVQ